MKRIPKQIALPITLLTFIAVSSGCEPKTCEPAPLPAEFAHMAEALPASAVTCGGSETSFTVSYKLRSKKEAMLETIKSMEAAGWDTPEQKLDLTILGVHKDGLCMTFTITEAQGMIRAGVRKGERLTTRCSFY